MKKLLIMCAAALLLTVASVPAFAKNVDCPQNNCTSVCPNNGECTNTPKLDGTGSKRGQGSSAKCKFGGNRDMSTSSAGKRGGKSSGNANNSNNGECTNTPKLDGTGCGRGNGGRGCRR